MLTLGVTVVVPDIDKPVPAETLVTVPVPAPIIDLAFAAVAL